MCLGQVDDTIQLDLATNKVQDIIKFEVGNLAMVTGGANAGRVGSMISRYCLSILLFFLCSFLATVEMLCKKTSEIKGAGHAIMAGGVH